MTTPPSYGSYPVYDPYSQASSLLPSQQQSQVPGAIVGSSQMTINTSQLNFAPHSAQGGLFGYSDVPGAGNLFFALAPSAGTDSYGNSWGAGLNASSGTLVTMSLIGSVMDQTSTLVGTQVQQPNVLQPVINGGTAVSMVHQMVNGGGQVLGYTQGTTAATFATNGQYQWTCPTGVTSVRVQCWGAGAGAGGGTTTQGGESGGAGEYAEEPTYSVIPGAVYEVSVGAGGQGGETGNLGFAGGATSFAPLLPSTPGITVNASGGIAGAFPAGGQGGTGSVNTIHFNGGNGAAASGQTGGNGGGSSAGPASQGNPGNQSAGSTGATGGAAVAGGGAGGNGGNVDTNGVNGSAPGGGGGGAGAGVTVVQSKNYSTSGTYCYKGADASVSPNTLYNHNGNMYQGYATPVINGLTNGNMYSYFTLPFAQIQSDLSGATVTSVVIWLKALYSASSSNLWIHLSYSNSGSFGNTAPSDTKTAVSVYPASVGNVVGQNVGTNGSIGTALQNGNCKSILIGPGNSNSNESWGWVDSGGSGGYTPNITVHFYTGTTVVSAGNGADGQCVISYQSATPALQLAISSVSSTDAYGYTFQPGFTGPQLNLPAQASPPAATAATGILTANTAATPSAVLPSGHIGTLALARTDTTSAFPITVSQSVWTNLTLQHTIPSGDAHAGTVYRLTAWGDLTTPASALQACRWGVTAFGQTATTMAYCSIAAAALAASTTYEWVMTSYVSVRAAGASGTVDTWMTGSLSILQGTNLSNTNTYALTGGSAGTTVVTTTVSTFGLQAEWAATETGQQVRNFGSVMERLGT